MACATAKVQSSTPSLTQSTTQSPTLGLIGGLSWHSTLIYYQKLNEGFASIFGSDRSAPLLLYSHDFGMIGRSQANGKWKDVEDQIVHSARLLAQSGCEAIVIASNTIHKFVRVIEASTQRPVLHMGSAIATAVTKNSSKRVGFLGTRPTMEEPFLKRRIQESASVELCIPTRPERDEIHRVIWERLVRGCVDDQDRQAFQIFCDEWARRERLDSIVLSCTELGLLGLKERGFRIFDSLEAHVDYALQFYKDRSPHFVHE